MTSGIWSNDFSKINFDEYNDTDPTHTGYFLKYCSEECNNLSLSRSHYLFYEETDRLLGFITISSEKVQWYKTGPRGLSNLPKSNNKDHFPVIKIDRIAVNGDYQRKGIGSYILKIFIGKVSNFIRPITGCNYIIVQALNNNVNINFFTKNGFNKIKNDWLNESKIYTSRKEKIIVEGESRIVSKEYVFMVFNLNQ